MVQMDNNIAGQQREVETLKARLADSRAEALQLAPKAAKWDSWNKNKGRKTNR